MRLTDNFGKTGDVHSFQKIEGLLALDQNKIIIEKPLSEGDLITWFSLPDGKFLVCKDPNGTPIKRITSAYLYLESEVNWEEK